MSMIEKMSIMGIRSFGPDDANQQVIQFQHPLTLLLGPNGAGKTTIIECLKYATTGEHPLNTKGGAFVHDPKLAHENEVRAKVRLKCHTIFGQQITIERSMIAIQKQKTVQFKTLDGVITKIRNDELVQITSKCAELNREMVSALGVSKAVLDNVIFCHQEESNWPLSEGKSVKQRFDDIFAATRYIKALDEIRKIQKDQKNEKVKADVALPHLKGYSERAEELKTNLETAKTKLEAIKQSNQEINQQLIPVENQLRELSRKENDIRKLDGELGNLKIRKEQMVNDRGKLESRIENKFYGTDEQLKEVMENQNQVLESKKQNQLQSEQSIEPLEKDIEKTNIKKTDLLVREGNLQQQVKNYVKLKQNRNNLIRKLCLESGIRLLSSSHSDVTEDQVEEFERLFKDYSRNEIKQLKNEKTRLEKEKENIEQKYQELVRVETSLAEGCKHKQNSLNELKEKIKKNHRELKRIQSAADGSQLNVLQSQLISAQNELQSYENSINMNQLRNGLRELEEKKSNLEKQVESLDDKLIKMQGFAETRTKIGMLDKDKVSKEKSVHQLKSKNQKLLAQVGLASVSSFPDQRKLSQWIKEKETEIKNIQTTYDSEKSKLTKLKTRQEMIKNQLKEKQTCLNELDDEMFDVCGSQDIDHELSVLEADINKLQGKKGLTDGIQYMYKKFIDDMKTDDVSDKREIPCPLCQRLFDEPSEVDELVSILEKKLVCAPKKLEGQIKELERKQSRYKTLQDHKPTKQRMDRLKVEIGQLKEQHSKLTSEVSPMKNQIETLENDLSQMREDENLVKKCLPDVLQIDSLMVDITNLSRQIQNLESELPVATSSESIDELNTNKRALSFELKNVSQSIDKKRRDIEKQVNLVHSLKEKVNSIQAEKLELASDLQKCEQLEQHQKSLVADSERIKSEIEQNNEKMEPLSRQVEELTRQKQEIAKQCEEKFIELNRRSQVLEEKYSDVEAMNSDIQKFEESGLNEKLERTEKQIKDVTVKLEDSKNRLEDLRSNIAKMQKDLVKCKERQRDLEDNLALRERSRDIDDVARQIGLVEEKLGGMDADKLSKEKSELGRKYDLLKKDQVRNSEREVHSAHEVEALKKEFSKDDIKLADKRYLECLVNSTTMELASDDLGKYYKALDRAVMRFHKIKMDEINKIIKDLWQETYGGKDIDYIEICSSEDTGASTRRVFNYRVVMYSNDIAMDMRGRCSAGQKVLASLVIRLALAETFCINCGILALDEPTTNLDRENIEGLAKALVSIIESRSQQRNFQLVVITHDEEFVELLGKSNYVDHFFRINKDDRARSRIIKCPIRLLES